jgi:SSS family solute:Na+ symporter
MVQRFLAAKSDKAALKGIAIGASLCIPVWTLFMLMGTLLWSYYRLTGEVLPSHIQKADQVFPYFISTHIHAGLAGFFLASLFGAAMATLSSDLSCLSVVGVEDFYRRIFPHSSDRARLTMGKLLVAIYGAFGIVSAVALAKSSGTALSLWYTLSAILAGGLAGLFLLAFFSKRANRTGAYIGIAANLVFTTWATLTLDGGKIVDLGRFNFPLHNYMIGVLGNVILLVVGYLASLPFAGEVEAQDMTLWGWLEKKKREGREEASLKEEPAYTD